MIYKIRLKWIIDLNTKSKTLKLLKENIREIICDLRLCRVLCLLRKKDMSHERKRENINPRLEENI